MSRSIFPFAVNDISALARSLNTQIAQCDGKPGHVELLNMLSRASGFRNFQHFRASLSAQERLDQPQAVAQPVDHTLVERLARNFNDQGILVHWPSKASHRELCLWVLWSRLEPRKSVNELQINEFLKGCHEFGDHALLRRELSDQGFVMRTPDGRDYRRIERSPPAEALALIRHLQSRKTV